MYVHFTHRSKDEKKQLVAIRKSCRNFFLEVVSGLCFGQSTVPDDDLVEMLLNIVFTEKAQVEGGGEEGRLGTRVLTPYYKDDPKERDETPIIRSFLLQLLLEHKYVHNHNISVDHSLILIPSPNPNPLAQRKLRGI